MVLSGCSRPSSRAFRVAFRLVSSTPPVFRRTTKAFVTSPMPCVTSTPVLQPRISTERAGPLGELVCVMSGVSEGSSVAVIVALGTLKLVAVALCGVDVGLAAMMIGVGVKMDGVFVIGRNGVGPGWITQPLQDANKNVIR